MQRRYTAELGATHDSDMSLCRVSLDSVALPHVYCPRVNKSTGHTHTHTTAEKITHTNTRRATAQRRVIVGVVVAAPKIVV